MATIAELQQLKNDALAICNSTNPYGPVDPRHFTEQQKITQACNDFTKYQMQIDELNKNQSTNQNQSNSNTTTQFQGTASGSNKKYYIIGGIIILIVIGYLLYRRYKS